jgi:hypothetical protein
MDDVKSNNPHADDCGFALYGPPALCTCRAAITRQPLVYRLVRELYESHEERGFKNVGLELCNAENFTMSVGPNPGGDSERCFSLLVSQDRGNTMRDTTHLFFTEEDDLPARQLAQALMAWADWLEGELAKDQEMEAGRKGDEREMEAP